MVMLSTGEWVGAGVLFAIVFGAAGTIVTVLGAWVYRADRRNRSHPHGPSPS